MGLNDPYQEISIVGQGLLTFGFQEMNLTDGLALLTDGFVSGQLATTIWTPAIAETGVTMTSWSLALCETQVMTTTWSPAISETGVTMTTWIDAISEIPPNG